MSSSLEKDIRERLASLTPDELEALLRSLETDGQRAAKGAQVSSKHMSEEESGNGVFPATYAQILFWRQYDANRSASLNHQSMSFRIRGVLDVEALKSSFRILSESQPSLRTVYFEDDRDVWQHVKPSLPIPVECIHGDEGCDMDTFLRRPFNLETEPPIRVRLVREGDGVHLMQIVLHHIATDGRSKVVMLQELSESYNSIRAGEVASTRVRRKSLGDKAILERKWLSEQESEESTRYWKESSFLEGMGHRWPEGRHRVSHKVYGPNVSGSMDIDLGEELSQRIRSYAAGRGMTPLQLLLGCYLLTLQRLVPGEAVTVGMPVEMRLNEEDASQVGCFMNVVPITMDAEPPGSIEDYLALTSERMRRAIEYARMPLYRILEIGYASHVSARSLSWKTLVNFKEDYGHSLILNGLSVECLPLKKSSHVGDIELTIHVGKGDADGGSIRLTADIDVDKVSYTHASDILATWRSVIAQCVDGGVQAVSDIDILLPGERERLLELSGRDKTVTYPFDKTIVDLFDAQVCKTPDAVALSFHETILTYRELNSLANQLAHYLARRCEIVPDQLIGIELPRSEWIVIGILAILKSGGAYVPIDPDQPRQRKDYIRGDAQLEFILDQRELDLFKSLCSQDALPITNPNVKLTPGNLAYVIYTSGTTGSPKGVLIEHRNVVRLMCNDNFLFDFSERDVWTLAHSYNFDFSVWEMFGALLYGGELVVVPLDVTKDGQSFSHLILNRGVTILSQTPSSFYSLSESIALYHGSQRHKIRYVIFGGEALVPTRLSSWFKMYPETRLVNMYGITETTVHVTHKEIGAVEISEGSSNIGRPIPTLSCHILDGKMCLCPPGLSGELYVGGAGLARGYLNRDELTADRFISSPIFDGERLYRTGDICRWREDGCLEYLGRCDDQVKIRGYRIELGEVTSALLRCSGVREAVVLAEPDGEGSNRLRAWMTLQEGILTNESSIRSTLMELLPGYMVPFRVHMIEAIPLTSNGKTDHRALRAMAAEAGDESDGQPLITPTEQRLAALWSELLGVEVKSRDADFFLLGGHSISAMRMVARIKKKFGVSISIPDVFLDASLSGLSFRIDAAIFASSDKALGGRSGEHVSMMVSPPLRQFKTGTRRQRSIPPPTFKQLCGYWLIQRKGRSGFRTPPSCIVSGADWMLRL